MEEPEPGELRSSEQPELLSLIISGGEEEEATPERSDCRGKEEEALANGHVVEESGANPALTPVKSPGTSYWSITEGPDHPLLLSPAPGPSAQKPKVQKASRPGLSRIPGRDHRRYYHEYWRSEYLMDFDPQRHGMICMVCGSSLATLKLSTIKRHIKQKHPDSLLWSAADKEVIRSGWESHLNLAGSQMSYSSDAAGPPAQEDEEEEEQPDSGGHTAAEPQDLVAPQEQPQQTLSLSPKSEEVEVPQPQDEQQDEEQDEEQEPQDEEQEQEQEQEQDLAGPSAQTLERYLNDSLHAWFRQEFLMEYESDANRLLCMVCGGELPSLHLNHIKSHVLDTHPNSLVYSAEEKHCILQAWAQAHEESENSIKSEPSTKDGGVDLLAQDAEDAQMDMDSYPQSDGASTQDTCLIGEDGGVGAPLRQSRRKRLRGGDPWQLRLDYMVAYGPQGQDTYCMVCSQVLHETKVSSFRRHIQESHPETLALSQQDREAMAAAWTKDYSSEGVQSQDEINSVAAGETNDDSCSDVTTPTKTVKRERGRGGTPSRHSHYPGKDQRRNYQVRWRMEYLMDYDSGRHGLICIVCGATLATLKVSTIKRHIQQVHPYSLQFSPEKKQQALLSYNQSGVHVLHFDDCFSSQDFGHTELAPSPTQVDA